MSIVTSDLERINTSLTVRSRIFSKLFADKKELEKMIILATENKSISAKAMRAVETVVRVNHTLILPHIPELIKFAKNSKKNEEIRPIAKIFEILTSLDINIFSEKEIDEMVPLLFDWFIGNQKTAIKAHSMTALFHLKEKREWIATELKLLLNKNYPCESAGYKARARMILKKMR